MDIKIIEFTDKITITHSDGTTDVYVKEVPPIVYPTVTIPGGTPVNIVIEG